MAHEAMDEAMTGDKSIETNRPNVESTAPTSPPVATQTSQSDTSPQSNANEDATTPKKQSTPSNPSADQSREEEHKGHGNESNDPIAPSSNDTTPATIQPPGERLEQYNIAANEEEEQENAEAVEERKQEHERRFDPWKYDPESNCPWAYDSEVRRESSRESHESHESGKNVEQKGVNVTGMLWLHL